MKAFISITATLFLLSTAAFAGTERGNGGDGKLCPNSNSTKPMEFYDLHEAKDRYEFRLVPSRATTLNEKVEELLSRLDSINPSRAQKYRAWFKTFFTETKFVVGKELIDIPDTGPGSIPKGCALKQIAIQQAPKLPTEKRYQIDQEYWNLMDLDNQAALIVHELILREASEELNHATSEDTRYLHALIEADKIKDFSLNEYLEMLKNRNFDWADFKGLVVSLKNSTFYGGKIPGSLQIATSREIEMNQMKISILCDRPTLPSKLHFVFSEAGELREIKNYSPYDSHCNISSFSQEKAGLSVQGSYPEFIEFYRGRNGAISRIVKSDYEATLFVRTPLFHLASTNLQKVEVFFTPDGQASSH